MNFRKIFESFTNRKDEGRGQQERSRSKLVQEFNNQVIYVGLPNNIKAENIKL